MLDRQTDGAAYRWFSRRIGGIGPTGAIDSKPGEIRPKIIQRVWRSRSFALAFDHIATGDRIIAKTL